MIANIKGSMDGHYFMALNQVVVIDRGFDDGLSQGSTFELSKQGAVIYGGKGNYRYKKEIGVNGFSSAELPPVAIGQMVVIRPYAKFSLALITQSDEPIGVKEYCNFPVQTNHVNPSTQNTASSKSSQDDDNA